MNSPIDGPTRVMAEARRLLESIAWDTEKGTYLEGETVCLLLDPCPNGEEDSVDVPVSVFPLACAAAEIQGAGVVLCPVGGEGSLHYGRLDRRGQKLFRMVEKGSYRMELPPPVTVPAEEEDRIPGRSGVNLVSVHRQEALMAAAADTGERRWRKRYRSAGGALTATVWERETGGLELDFEARDRAWDGAVVEFNWAREDGEPGLLLAVLAWSDQFQGCVAEVNLGQIEEGFELGLPEEPRPVESLSGVAAEVLDKSVARAREPTRRAWRKLLKEHPSLPSEVRLALEKALEG